MVVTIIAVLIGMALPAFTMMMRSNKQGAAQTTISSALTLAQAQAAQTQRYAGVRFQQAESGRQYVVLIEKAVGGSAYEYHAVANMKPMALPLGIGAISAQVDSEASYDAGDADKYLEDYGVSGDPCYCLENATTFSLVFSPGGQLVVKRVQLQPRDPCDPVVGYDGTVGDVRQGGALLYCDDGYWPHGITAAWCIRKDSTTGLYIYDTGAMAEVNRNRRWSDYIGGADRETGVRRLWINGYTGKIIEEGGN